MTYIPGDEILDKVIKGRYGVLHDDLIMSNDNGVCFTIPKIAGGYRIGVDAHSHQFNLLEKPSFIKRFLMKHLLGFEWVDA